MNIGGGDGFGSLVFQALLEASLTAALVAFGTSGLALAAIAVGAFRSETAPHR